MSLAVWTPAQPSRQPLVQPLQLCQASTSKGLTAPGPQPSIPILISDWRWLKSEAGCAVRSLCACSWATTEPAGAQAAQCVQAEVTWVASPPPSWSPSAVLSTLAQEHGSGAGVHHLAQLSEANSLPEVP